MSLPFGVLAFLAVSMPAAVLVMVVHPFGPHGLSLAVSVVARVER